MVEYLIRDANLEDAAKLADLMGQLGYPTSSEEMSDRLVPILSENSHKIFVAVANDKIIGLLGANLAYYFEKNGKYALVTALVVDKTFRGQGVGKQLSQATEKWAKLNGARAMIVHSGTHRTDAHSFYREIGYKETGIRFVLELSGDT